MRTSPLRQISELPQQEVWWLARDKYHVHQHTFQQWWQMIQSAENQRSLRALPPAFLGDLQRLAAGEPIAYVIGWVSFLGCHIDLQYQPLIPRPETEWWVERAIKEMKHRFSARKAIEVLDLCSGSGCIGLAVLKHVPAAKLTFVDVDSEGAIVQTRLNINNNPFAVGRSEVISSDLWQNLGTRTFDVILTNPPYVDPDGEVSADLAWEPSRALFAQNHGLALIERIFSEAKKHLNPGGELWLEFGQGQRPAIEKILSSFGFGKNEHIAFLRDQFGVERVVRVQSEN